MISKVNSNPVGPYAPGQLLVTAHILDFVPPSEENKEDELLVDLTYRMLACKKGRPSWNHRWDTPSQSWKEEIPNHYTSVFIPI